MTREIGAYVQKLRLQRGWSQEQLAAVCALSVRTIQRIERGQPASLETRKALASVLEVDLVSLQEPAMEQASPTAISNTEMLALAHVRRLKRFYLHIAQYVLTIVILATFNLVVTPRHFWVGWVALAWGLGLMCHALRAFDRVPFLTAAWERRRVEQYLGRRL